MDKKASNESNTKILEILEIAYRFFPSTKLTGGFKVSEGAGVGRVAGASFTAGCLSTRPKNKGAS